MPGSSTLLEQLEPRILLDAASMVSAGQFTSGANLESSLTPGLHSDTPTAPSHLEYNPSGDIQADLLAGAQPLQAFSASTTATDNATGLETPTPPATPKADGPTQNSPETPNHAVHLGTAGVLDSNGSPNIQHVSGFTQGEGESTEVEIAGPGAAGAVNGYDQIQVTGLATLGGQLKITLLGGFVPSVGQTFDVMTWSSHTGEFADWLGTAVPGHPELAFQPVYNSGGLRLQVIQTPLLSATAESAVTTGLNAMSQVTTAINSISTLAQSLPLIGSSIGSIANIGSGFANAVSNKINALIALLPRESSVTELIQGLDGTSVAGFTINIEGVLGNYGATSSDPFSYDIHLSLTPTTLNSALTSVANSVFGAVFGGRPSVAVHGNIDLDFSFGYSSGFYVDIHHIEAGVEVTASGTGGGNFNFSPPGSPVSLALGNWSVDLEASVTATPDDSVLSGGRITSTTLSNIAGGTIPVQDAFNLTKEGTLNASFALVGSLNVLGISASAVTTLSIQSSDIFSGDEPDVTLEVNGSISIFNQSLSGDFIFRKTVTDTTISATNVSLDLKAGTGAGAKKILHAENGTGEFLLVDGDLAGTASLSITQGPDIPNISITGTTLSLALNETNTAVPTINGVPVNLPAGNYFRLSGNTTVALTTPQVSLSGAFSFESYDPTPGAPSSGDEIVTVSGTGLTFDLKAGSVAGLHATNVSGAFILNEQGMAGTARGDVTLVVPEVDLSGTFDILINDGNLAVNQTVSVNGVDITVNVPAGPYIRIMANDALLRVATVTLSGDFVFEEKKTTPDNQDVITVKASNVSLELGTTTLNLVHITNGAGLFILTDAGLAGQASASITLGVTAVSLLSSTVGSEAWNSRDLKSRPH